MIAWFLMVTVPAQALSFEQTLSLADASPSLSAASTAIERRRALAEVIPWLTANPSVLVQPGGRRMAQGTFGPELYLGLSQEVSLAGAGVARRAAAMAEVDADTEERAVLRRGLVIAAAQAWLSLWAAQVALEAARAELTLTKEWQARVAKGAAVGGFTRVDVAVANAYQAEAHLTALSLEGEAFVRGVQLNRVVGRDANRPAVATAALPVVTIDDERVSHVTETAETSPPVRSAKATVEVERLKEREAEASRGTSLQVGALAWREGAGDLAAVASLQLTLPVFERAQRERSVAAAALSRAEGRTLTALADERAERVDALHELEHSLETLRVVEDELLPASREALDGMQRRFDAGEATAQELVLTRRALMSTKARHARAQADVVFARFHLAMLTSEVTR
ncbi:MAG: TolC family protein [Myxococcales bacterium]|nr:TolC family protein [Myxococcales bacterium]